MPEGLVVADSGPLIAFSLLGRLDLLRDVYTSFWYPRPCGVKLRQVRRIGLASPRSLVVRGW